MGSAYFTDCLHTGAIGETIVSDYLTSTGHHVYSSCAAGSHPIDFYVTDCTGVPQYAADVKTYPRRAYFNDTGIDASDWEKYAHIAPRMPVRLYFVDSFECCCYSADLSEAGKVAKQEGGKVYFPLSVCRFEFWLTSAQLASIAPRRLDRYANTKRYFADNSHITAT